MFLTSSRLNLPLVTFGRVAITDSIIDATVDVIKINVGKIKYVFEGLSNFGSKLDKATEIIIAFTESKILALVSAISLKVI